MSSERDAAIILIGNELLSGRIADQNLAFLARELWSLGVPVREVLIVRDAVEAIAEAVEWLSPRRSWVFTAGGIGPTHDDLTVEGVARAFGVAVVEIDELAKPIRARWGARITESHLRMARAPEGAVLEAGAPGVWPTVRKENVFLLPGVPAILRRKFERLKPLFAQTPFHRRSVTVRTEEATIAGPLGRIAREHPSVEIGSYPSREIVVITAESHDPAALEQAYRDLERSLADIPRATPPSRED